MRPRLQCGEMVSLAFKSQGMNKSLSKPFLVFKEDKNGKALTMIPKDMQCPGIETI